MANVSSSNGLEKRPKLRFPGFDEPWRCSALSKLFDYERPDKYIVSSENYTSDGTIPVLTANQSFILGYTNETDGIYKKGEVIVFDDFTCDMKYANFPFKVKSSAIKLLTTRDSMPVYFGYNLLRHINYKPMGHARHWISVLQSYMTSIPSLSEQQKISIFLKLVDQRIDFQAKYIDALKKYKRGVISALLSSKTNPYYSSETWKEVALCDVASGFEYGMNAAATVYDGSHKYIRITDIDDNSHLYSQDVPVSPEGQVDEKYRVRENDILFARTGASVGKSYRYQRSDGDLYYAGFLIRIHVNSDVNCGYVFQNTLTEAYRRWVLLESARSGQPGINAEQYKQYRFLLPPLELQNKISTLSTNLDNLICKEGNLLSQIEQVKIALLQRLFI